MKISRSDLENKTCGLRNQTALRLEFEMLNKKFIAPYTCKIHYNSALYMQQKQPKHDVKMIGLRFSFMKNADD